MAAFDPTRRAGPRPRLRALRWALPSLAGLAVLVLGLRSLLGSRGEIGRAAALLTHPAAGWLCLAVACEIASYIAYGCAQRRIARAAGAQLNVPWLAALSVAAQAVNNFVPGGYVAANVLNFRELRRRGLTVPASGWTLMMTTLLYLGALLGLGLVASEMARPTSGQPPAVRVVAAVGLGVIVVVAVGALLFTCPAVKRRGGALARRRLGRFADLRLPRRVALGSAAWFAGSWLADAGCLACACLAVRTAVPWSTLLLAYSGAQLMAFLPLTPGGLGLVEGSLVLGLGVAGGGGSKILAAVLLYRFVNYWGTLPAGAGGYLALRRAGRRQSADAPAELVGPALAAPALASAATGP